MAGMRIVFTVLLIASIATRVLAQAPDDYARARALALDAQRPEAIALLRAYLQTTPTDVDSRVLLGTVLSWEGQYDAARTELEQVLVAHPGYGDAIASLMNVELWSDHPRRALEVARRGLAVAPNDQRFIQGRERATHQLDLVRPWSVSASTSYDWFDDHRSAWKETQATLKRDTPAGAVILRGLHADRFSLSDNQFEVEMYPRFRPGTYAYVSGGYAPRKVLYPGYRLAADLYQSLGAGFEGSIGYRRLGFSTPTDIYVVTINKYVGNWLLTGKGFYLPDQTGASSRSFHGSFRRYFGAEGTSYVGARYSHGSAREEIRDIHDFEVLGSDTIAAEWQADIGRRLVVNASGSTSRQARVSQSQLRQNSVSATIGVRF